MALNLSSQPKAVQIGDNEYHLPTAITPRLRAKTEKQQKAFDDATTAAMRADLKTLQANDADEAAKATAEQDQASRKRADAARAYLGALLTTMEGAAVEKVADVMLDVADKEAVDLAYELIGGSRVDLDPQPAA